MSTRAVALVLAAGTLIGCASSEKCNLTSATSVLDAKTCQVRIRSVAVADELAPDMKRRLKENPNLQVNWVPTAVVNGNIVPGHQVIDLKSVGGDK
jgi:hypothetical protein